MQTTKYFSIKYCKNNKNRNIMQLSLCFSFFYMHYVMSLYSVGYILTVTRLYSFLPHTSKKAKSMRVERIQKADMPAVA